MNILNKFKGLIITCVILGIGFIAYTYFISQPEEQTLSAQNTSDAPVVDQDLISLLLTLRSIKLDEKIFSDTAFRSLEDFSKELIAEPVGRNNPFAPLGARETAPQGQ